MSAFSGRWTWEFTKVLTYQNRFFSKTQITAISAASNLPMYWPSRAHDAATGRPASRWTYNSGGPGCQESANCEYPRTFANSRLQPLPNGGQRVVLIVVGGLRAADEYTSFLSFRQRAGWASDSVELLMRAMLPTNAVPNWSAILTGLVQTRAVAEHTVVSLSCVPHIIPLHVACSSHRSFARPGRNPWKPQRGNNCIRQYIPYDEALSR